MPEDPIAQNLKQNDLSQDITPDRLEVPQSIANPDVTFEKLQNLIDTIQKPIETQEDLDQLLEILSLASPEFAAPLITDAKAHVPIQIGTISVAVRSTDQVIHRPTTYASKVTIAKGTKTGVFDVIHELRHAVPLASHDQDTGINPKGQNREQLEAAIRQLSYYDEANSIEAEIKIVEALELLGVDISVYEKIRPGIRKAYKESGVIGLSQQLPELVPPYKDYYDDFSRRFATALENEAVAKEAQWTDSGVEIKAEGGKLNLQIDPGKLLAKLANINPDMLPDQVKEFVTGAADLLDQYLKKKRDQTVKEEQIEPVTSAKKELPHLVFEPRPEPENKRKEEITESPEKTEHRVDIAGKFADFLKEARSANHREQAANFDEIMAFAEHSYGSQASTLYTECYEMLKKGSDDRDSSDRIKKLGLSLLKAGYSAQGHDLLTYYVDSYGVNSGLEKIGELSAELIEAGKSDIALRMVGEAKKRLTGLEESSLPERYLQHYTRHEGCLTDKGKELLDTFIKSRQGKIITAREFHDFILDLHKQGEYVLEEDWAKYVLEQPPTHEEEEYYEYLAKLSSAGRSFTKAAALSNVGSQQSKDYSNIAKEAYRLSIFGARQRFTVRMQEWEDKFKGTHYDPQKGLADFVTQILAHPQSSKEYDFDEYAAGECSNVLQDIFSDKTTFSQGLDLLYSLDDGLKKTSLFEYASKHIPTDLDSAVLDQFVNQWQNSLNATCSSLKPNNFIEVTNRFGNRQDWIMKQDTGVRPTHSNDIHLYFQQSILMVQMLLQRPEQRYHQQAIALIEKLPQSERLFFNAYEYISPSNFLFGEPSGYTIHTVTEFNQQIAKSRTFLKAAQLSPEDNARLIAQAADIVSNLTINPGSETFQQTEDKIYLLIELTEGLIQSGNITEAQVMYKRIGKALNIMEQHWQRKHEGNLALPEGVKRENWGDSWELERNAEKARFWQQDYESRLKTKMVLGLQQTGQTEEAEALLREMTDSFGKDVRGRRDRFDIKSMIESAKMVANTTGLTNKGTALFDLAIEKLELLRGDKNVFNEAVSFFSESVRGCQIPDQEKDKLLSQLIVKLAPDKKGDWREMFESIPGLVKTAKAITDEKKYPQAELEALRIFKSLIADVEYSHGDRWGNTGKMTALRELFTYIAKDNPEILIGSNFDSLLQVSQEPDYLKNLSALLPVEAERFYQGDIVKDGVFDLTKIRSGFYDKASVYELARTELEHVLSSPELTKERLDHLMKVYSELIRQDLASFMGQKPEDTRIKMDELITLKGVHDLHQLIDDKIHRPEYEFSEADKKILATLLKAETSDESNGKYGLYESIVGASKTHILAQRVAFENLIKSGRISNYAASYFGDVVISADIETQKKFFSWVKTFLKTEKGHLPDDRILAYLFNHPDQANDFFKRYHTSNRLDTVPEKIDEKMYFDKGLGGFFKGTKEQFFALRDSFFEKKKFWLPDLLNETDLLLAYEKRFNWFMSFDQFIEGVRHIYINGSFDPTGPYDLKYTYTPQQLEAAIKRIHPTFQFNEEQLGILKQAFRVNKNAYDLRDYQAARAIPDIRGQISYNQLTSCVIPNLKLSEQQRDDLIIFLNGLRGEYFILLRTFGRDNLTAEQQISLGLLLDSARKDYENRQEKIRNAKVETPEVFEKMPEVVKFMMTRFFSQLPYGEREAILKEFDKSTEPLTPQKAIKRFFELSGTEKVGQFLSTRRDLITDDYRKELEQFQEDVESSAFDEVSRTIESELGKPTDQLFSAIEPRPLKVGTIGEVYKVTLTNGREAVVKVITPSKRRAVKRMLDRLEHVCQDLERNKERFPGSYDPMAMFSEFKKSMEEELDFTYEYQNAENMRRNLPEKVSIPGYERSLCTKSILTQLYAQGVHIRELTNEKTKQAVIDTLGNLLINQFINTGVFHDDLHPGNIRINPATGEIELLDFGRTGYANESERSSLIPLLLAIRTKSVKEIVDILHVVSPKPNGFDRVGLEEALRKTMKEEHLKTSMLISRVFFECANHGLAVNPVYLRMLKGVMTFEGTAMQLDSNFSFESFIQKMVVGKLIGGFSPLPSKLLKRILRQ